MDPRRGLVSVVLTLFILLGGLMPASAADPPSIRLVPASHEVIAYKHGKRVWIDPATYVASVGGAFDLRLSRPSYTQPIDLYQFDPQTNQIVRDLPEDVLDGWYGLREFFTLTIENKDGEELINWTWSFCPNQGDHQRIDDSGPVAPEYPQWCAGHPLMKGMVWGIDEGWSVSALGWDGGVVLRAPVATYTMTVAVNEPYTDLFDIAPQDAAAVMKLRIKKGESQASLAPGNDDGQADAQPQSGVPEDTSPHPATLPDLVALPAWNIGVHRHQGREYLRFLAMEWNAGPQPLVVEGFRQPDEAVMDAYQYFYEDGEPVGRAPVGTMKFHEKKGHHHWHFKQFTEYTLLDATKSEAVVSNKRSWCLAPTDPVDLTVPGADWQPDYVGLHSACGYPGSLWVREVLPVGWGDTYFQYVAGQAFDITDLPNGTYYLEVQVNPMESLYETDDTNNVVLRKIKLRGEPGHRTVIVPPWQGIDTEGYGYSGVAGP